MKGKPEHLDLVHLVERREKVGRFLLDLRQFAHEHLSNSSNAERTVFHLLLASGFSLWRAAFLVEGQRDQSRITEHATEFLDVLLWDNAINFPQDRRTHAWTGGYYLNNACIRLLHIRDRLNLTTEDRELFGRLAAFLDGQWHSPSLVPDLRAGWDDCHAAALVSLTRLREHLVASAGN